VSIAIRKGRSSSTSADEPIRPRRWTREEYHCAADLGLFGPEERLELLDGEIYAKMSPRKPPHSTAVGHAGDVLARLFGPGFHTCTEQPLVLNDLSEPEPDIVIVPGARFDYQTEHPRTAVALLVAEVADTSLRFDRSQKGQAYARAGISDYWISSLRKRQLKLHRDPAGSHYRSVTILGEEDTVVPLAAPHTTLRVSDLLPPRSIRAAK
jgi:Uma2 family endonuclease